MFERLIAFLVVVAGILALGAALNAEDAPRTAQTDAGEGPFAPEAPAPVVQEADPERRSDRKGRDG